jgi:AraC-like DNA-binding protein
MNIFLLSIIDKRIGRVMTRLSQLRHFQFFLDAGHHEILLNQSKTVVDTYVRFFRCVHLLPDDYNYNEATIIKILPITGLASENAKRIDKKLFGLINPASTAVIPVSVHITQNNEILLYLGLGIIDTAEKLGRFYLHELSVPTTAFNYSQQDRSYLEDALKSERIAKIKSLRLLAAEYGKNYNHFQQDSREYFGDTFHQFQNKLRMMDVLEDVIFTTDSFKEIAYRHNFSGYNSMYTLFNKQYKFPLDSIPRLLTEK